MFLRPGEMVPGSGWSNFASQIGPGICVMDVGSVASQNYFSCIICSEEYVEMTTEDLIKCNNANIVRQKGQRL